jgi:hypothetical protein
VQTVSLKGRPIIDVVRQHRCVGGMLRGGVPVRIEKNRNTEKQLVLIVFGMQVTHAGN